MRLANARSALPYLLPLVLLLFALDASAEVSSQGLMDDVLQKFKNQATGWGDTFKSHASWLFWTLAVISLTWTFGMMALRKAEIGEFFAELIRFAIFAGFFWWLLDNGPTFANAIIDSLTQIGGSANQKVGYSPEFTPSGIVDIGFYAIDRSIQAASIRSPVTSLAGFIFAFGILLLTVMIGVNMLMLLASAWILAYAGIFILGFGGSKWTQEMALNYYRTVLGIGLQIMTMLLLVGIGNAIIKEYFDNISKSPAISEMAVVFVVAFIVYQLSSKVPPMVAGMVSGGSGGGDMGMGGFAGGAAVGVGTAMATAGGAIASVGKGAIPAAVKGVAGATGAGKAIGAAWDSAKQETKKTGSYGATSGSPLMRAMGLIGATTDRLVDSGARSAGRAVSQSFNNQVNNSAGGKMASDIKASDKAQPI